MRILLVVIWLIAGLGSVQAQETKDACDGSFQGGGACMFEGMIVEMEKRCKNLFLGCLKLRKTCLGDAFDSVSVGGFPELKRECDAKMLRCGKDCRDFLRYKREQEAKGN